MFRYLPVAVAVVLILITAVVQGIWTERWEEFPELELYAKQLQQVPKEIGDWVGEDANETESGKKILEIAGAVGSLSREYRNSSNDRVSVFLVCGRLGDVFFHTPDRCYPAAGFEQSGEITMQSVEIGSKVYDFKSAVYLKADAGGNQNLRIYWSFNANGDWVAPEEHRWSFAGQRALYKIYVVAPASGGDLAVDDNAAVEFIRVLMPELNKVLEPAFEESRRLKAGGAPTDAATAPAQKAAEEES